MSARSSVYILCAKDHGCKVIRLYIMCKRSWVQGHPFIYYVPKILSARSSVYIFCVKDHGCNAICYILCQRSWVQGHLFIYSVYIMGARQSIYILCQRLWAQGNPFIYSVPKIMGARQSVYIYILCHISWVHDYLFIYSESKIMGARPSVYIFCAKDNGWKTIRLYTLCQRSWVSGHPFIDHGCKTNSWKIRSELLESGNTKYSKLKPGDLSCLHAASVTQFHENSSTVVIEGTFIYHWTDWRSKD